MNLLVRRYQYFRETHYKGPGIMPERSTDSATTPPVL
jgi:hypothetical protein